MKNTNTSLVCKLVLFHIVIIALANYVVQFTGMLFIFYFTWAMFVFPIVLLATDLTVRLSNQKNARTIVSIAYIPAIAVSVVLASLVADWNWIIGLRIGFASGTAYLVGQLLDIAVFQKIREHNHRWWVAPLVSTFIANIVDTYLFFSVAFYRSANTFMAENWMEVATVDVSFKVIVSIIFFLPAYGVLLNYIQKQITAK